MADSAVFMVCIWAIRQMDFRKLIKVCSVSRSLWRRENGEYNPYFLINSVLLIFG